MDLSMLTFYIWLCWLIARFGHVLALSWYGTDYAEQLLFMTGWQNEQSTRRQAVRGVKFNILPAAEHSMKHSHQLFRDKSLASSVRDPYVSIRATCSIAVAATSVHL